MKEFLIKLVLIGIFAIFWGGIVAVIVYNSSLPPTKESKARFCVDCNCCFGDECECEKCPSYKGTKR